MAFTLSEISSALYFLESTFCALSFSVFCPLVLMVPSNAGAIETASGFIPEPSVISVTRKFTSAYLFQIAQEKSCDYLLIIYMKKIEMVKQKKLKRITQSGENCAINCTNQGVRLL